MSNEELSAYAEDVPRTTSNSIAMLSELADRQAKAEAEVSRLEDELEKAKAHYRDICERQLPEAMQEVGMEEFSTTTGLKIFIKNDLRANLSGERLYHGLKWLRDHGNQALIKRVISVPFGAGEDEKAQQTLEKLEGFPAEDKQTVHPQTLAAFIREQLQAGVNIPLELFGVFQQRVAVITRPGEQKSRSRKRKDDVKAPF